MLEYEGFSIFWDGHASVRIQDNGFTVAVDPYSRVSPEIEADIILITHRDSGHFDPEAIEAACGDMTCVVLPESMEEEDIPCDDVEYISEGEIVDIFGVEIEAIPMYNHYHERGEGFGYRFVMGEHSFYVAGDTGLIDEIWDLENRVDVAFLPVEGIYTMEVDDAIKAAVRIKADVNVPYHYGPPFFEERDPDVRGFIAALEDRNLRAEQIEPTNDLSGQE